MIPPLIPGVKTATWRTADATRAAADEAAARLRSVVLRRDNFTCRFCGFKTVPKPSAKPTTLLASGFLEVHHIDDDHHNNSEANLISACPFCHMVFHVGFHGHQGQANVIWLPWLSQADLNLLCNCAAVAVVRKGEIGHVAQSLLSSLASCRSYAVETLGGVIVDDPAALGTALLALFREDPGLYSERAVALRDIRILPATTLFDRAVRYWSETTWAPGDHWEDGWARIYEDWREAIMEEAS